MSTFTLKIRLGNEAMEDGYDVSQALRTCADHLEANGFENDVVGLIRDVNGNTVGSWELDA